MIWIAGFIFLFLLFGFVVFFGAPYVPSKRKDIERAFTDLYPVGSGDTLVDIGSGDGIVLRQAAKRGAAAVGYEINPLLVLLSRWLSRRDPAVTVRFASFWGAQLPRETTIVYVFGDSRDIAKMAGKIKETATELGRPLLLMSYGFTVPGLTHKKQAGPYYLYEIEPLQGSGA